MPKQPAFPGLRDAMKKKQTRREMFLARCHERFLRQQPERGGACAFGPDRGRGRQRYDPPAARDDPGLAGAPAGGWQAARAVRVGTSSPGCSEALTGAAGNESVKERLLEFGKT